METLETDRLILRLWQVEDVMDMYEYASDLRVGPNAGWPVHEQIETSEKIIEGFIKDKDVYAIVLKSENKVIGSIGLHHIKPDNLEVGQTQKEIGYVLNPKYWGKGIIPEAVAATLKYGFEVLKADLIWCCHFSFNENSKRVIKKTGFNFHDATNKRLPLLDDQEVESLRYLMSRADYFKSKLGAK